MKNIKFLVVEDDELSRIGLVNFLKKMGKVDEAATAKEGLNLLSENSYDVAFIDLDLEESRIGLTIVPEAAKSGVYPIVLSGREDDGTVGDAYELGCKDFLAKPFKSESVRQVLKAYQVSSLKGSISSLIVSYILLIISLASFSALDDKSIIFS